MIDRGVNAPLSSSAGRLFDAVAAALGVCFDRQGFEGEAGMRLEALARPFMDEETAYPLDISDGAPVRLSFAPMWQALLTDLREGVSPGRISARFHLGLVEGLAAALVRTGVQEGDLVMLSGGVFQNALLRDGLSDRLTEDGYKVLSQTKCPANDGGLALGQAAIAAVQSGRMPGHSSVRQAPPHAHPSS
jgi:hydrogenase maturation protein HypF